MTDRLEMQKRQAVLEDMENAEVILEFHREIMQRMTALGIEERHYQVSSEFGLNLTRVDFHADPESTAIFAEQFEQIRQQLIQLGKEKERNIRLEMLFLFEI